MPLRPKMRKINPNNKSRPIVPAPHGWPMELYVPGLMAVKAVLSLSSENVTPLGVVREGARREKARAPGVSRRGSAGASASGY